MDATSPASISSMSTTGSLAPCDRIISVKSSLSGIVWTWQWAYELHKLIRIVNRTTTHAFFFSKHMFLRAFEEDPYFDVSEYINREFFAEVWLSLIDYRTGTVGEVTAARRTFIAGYLDDYLRVSNYIREEMDYSQQPSFIEGTKIYTAYANNVTMNFGNSFRRAINLLLDVRGRINIIKGRRELTEERKKKLIHDQITLPAARFKTAIPTGLDGDRYALLNTRFPDIIYRNAIQILRPVFDSYPEGYNFRQDNIYYDFKARPTRQIPH